MTPALRMSVHRCTRKIELRLAADETLQNRIILAFHGSKYLLIDAVAPSFRRRMPGLHDSEISRGSNLNRSGSPIVSLLPLT